MWERLKHWAREVYPLLANEGGFLQWLIPLLLTAFQYTRQEAAKREIEKAEEAKIPEEESAITEELLQRGMGGSSFFRPAVAEPRRQFDVAKRVRRAQELLGTQTADPMAYGLDALMQRISRGQGGDLSGADASGGFLNLGRGRRRWYPSEDWR